MVAEDQPAPMLCSVTSLQQVSFKLHLQMFAVHKLPLLSV